jgi:hypothetical protein
VVEQQRHPVVEDLTQQQQQQRRRWQQQHVSVLFGLPAAVLSDAGGRVVA